MELIPKTFSRTQIFWGSAFEFHILECWFATIKADMVMPMEITLAFLVTARDFPLGWAEQHVEQALAFRQNRSFGVLGLQSLQRLANQ